MRILIDESLPRQLKQHLSEHRALTVQEMGWGGIKNADLLKKAEASFQVLITADKNLTRQQGLRGMHLIVIVFSSNRLRVVEQHVDWLKEALSLAKPGTIVEL